MKRIFSAVCIFLLIFSFAGCGFPRGNPEDQVSFYYSRREYAYGTSEPVIVAEQRDVAGHVGELNYLLSLYLMGPLEEDLTSLFPGTTKLLSAEQEEEILTVEISAVGKDMTDAQFSLACSCLSLTVLELTDANAVTIISGDRTVTMRSDDLLLFDDPIPEETLMEDTQ